MDQSEILLEHLWKDFNSKVTKIHTERRWKAEESGYSCRGTNYMYKHFRPTTTQVCYKPI